MRSLVLRFASVGLERMPGPSIDSNLYMPDWIFCSGSGLLSTSIGLNAVSAHGTCTAVFVAVSAIASFSLASIRTLGKMKWAAWAGVASVSTAGV